MTLPRLLRTSTFQLSLVYTVLFAGSVLLLLAFIYWATVGYMARQTDATIDAEIAGLAEQYRSRGLEGLVKVIQERMERDPEGASVYLFATRDFRPLAGNLSAWPDVPAQDDGWLAFEFRDPRAEGRVFEARARPFVLQGGLHLLVGRDIRELVATQALMVRALGWGLAITLALALVGGLLMTRSMTRRLDQINQTSREIMAGHLSRRIPLSGSGDDFDRLGGSLNAMLDEIEYLMDGIRHVSDNVAHDLRTPLTRLRNRLEQLRADLGTESPHLAELERAIGDADQLLNTFGALLRIARIEAGGHRARRVAVDLGALVTDAADLYGAVAEERALALDTLVSGAPLVQGDRDLLFQALVNLVDNAVKYTPRGGRVTLQAGVDDGSAFLRVADSGPGVPVENREKVLQRFYRLERSRSTPGSGLGLSLVAAVAQAHQAVLLLEDSSPGLRVTMRFDETTA